MNTEYITIWALLLLAVIGLSNLYMLSKIDIGLFKLKKVLLEKSQYDMKYQTAILRAKQHELVENYD